MNIVLIGAGNLAWHLGPALKKNGHDIIAVYSKTLIHAKELAKKTKSLSTNRLSDLPQSADLYIVAVQDKAIHQLVKSLSFVPKCIVHTSGSIPISVFPNKFKNTGVLYPLQSFSKTRKVNFKTIPFLIEGSSAPAKKAIKQVAESLTNQIKSVSSNKRKRIHLAAVFANNFVNYLYSISSDILQENKLPFELLKPLILETALKVQTNLPSKMQTGPARRSDEETIKMHLQLLKSNKTQRNIYKLLNDSIINKFK